MSAANVVVERIEIFWPHCYLVAGSGISVVVGKHEGRWVYGTSQREIYKGQGTVIDPNDGTDDLLAACRSALTVAAQPRGSRSNPRATAEGQRRPRCCLGSSDQARGVWEGCSGHRVHGRIFVGCRRESDVATGDPVLSILDCYSFDELADIRSAMKKMGRDGWYYPVVDWANTSSS
jgi:hypothetical protein